LEGNHFSIRKYYLIVILVAFALGVGTYVYFVTDNSVYTARGKFSYYFKTSESSTNNLPFTSDAMTKSISDSIQTRAFLEQMYKSASVEFTSNLANNPTKYIKSTVVEDSSVIQVSIFSENKETLSQLSRKFFTVLEGSAIISGTAPKPTINIVDPLFTDLKAVYPKPLEYSAIVFIGSLLIGIMFLYIFSNEN